MKRGFTLVELSIVLVIIGLLIGGILVAQSMMSTARITAQVQQLAQFDAGVESFKTKYRYIPGDAPQFGGDGDGLISDSNSINLHDVSRFNSESLSFWSDLFPEKYQNSAGSSDIGEPPSTSGNHINAPASKLGKKGAFFNASAIAVVSNAVASLSDPRNFYYILDATQAQALSPYNAYQFTPTSSSNSTVAPVDLLALDRKIDDGIANTGNVLSGSIVLCCSGIGGVKATALTTCSDNAGKYNLNYSTYECTPLIRIGGIAGDPQ